MREVRIDPGVWGIFPKDQNVHGHPSDFYKTKGM